MTNDAARELADRAFPCPDAKCPRCGETSIIGLLLVNEAQQHMHTWYVCTFWPSANPSSVRCGWTGWSVP